VRPANDYRILYQNSDEENQGLGNQLITPPAKVTALATPIQRRERVGGVLNYYYREAA
jgi:hypothetical protein